MNLAVNDRPVTPPVMAQASASEIERVFAAQRATMLRLRTSTVDERLAKIKKLKAAMLKYRQQFQDAGAADFKKPLSEVDLTEIMPVVAEANDAIRHLKSWVEAKGVLPSRLMMGTKSYLQYEPKGRALIIAPWNYPVNLCFGPLVSAIAAGCTAILKPSEMTPHLSALMVKIVQELFSEDEVAIFEGDAQVSTVLLALPFDHIFFTGSPAIGKVVMAAAAKHLTSVTLELGGKSPTIIDKTADLDMAAANMAWGKFTNNGQTCIAPDTIYVHEAVKDAFVQKLVARIESVYGSNADSQKSCPDLARVVNQRHTARLKALLDDAVAKGARVVSGGVVDEAACFIAPTVLEQVPEHAKINEEEIFGPLLPIHSFSNLQTVIDHINAHPKPLALYVWSQDEVVIEQVLRQTSSGGACVNHSVVQYIHGALPFGGVNNSGMGSAHGHYGFKAFSHERAVVRTRFMMAPMFYPPYTPKVRKIIETAIKLV